jgi:hypothetical protein
MAKRKTLAKKGRKNRRTRRNLLKRDGGGLGRDVGSILSFGIINGTDKYHNYKFRRDMDKIYAKTEEKAKKSGSEYTEEEKKYLRRFGQYED